MFYYDILYHITIGRSDRVIPGPIKCRSDFDDSTSSYSGLGWQCGDGYCIDRYHVCDGSFDCLNGRDEFDCGKYYKVSCMP